MSCILIIDDEALFRQVLCAALVQSGYSVLEAGDGDTAANLLRRFRVDLVLTDLVMPNGDGIEVIANIKLQAHPVPVIAMTGFQSETELFTGPAVQTGAQRLLMKPFSMETLLTTVSEVLSDVPTLQR
jgi:DNA-binding response OmpR family regulator